MLNFLIPLIKQASIFILKYVNLLFVHLFNTSKEKSLAVNPAALPFLVPWNKTAFDKEISLSRIYSFIEDIAKLHKQGLEVIIVTSGAVGLGAKKLNVDSSESLSIKQACAAVGQSQLMSIYEDGFSKYSINTAQILLTEDDFTNRIKYLNKKEKPSA